MYDFKGGYFIMSTRVHYSPEIKWKAIDMKLNGSTKKEVMNKLGIKNKSQIMTWLRWYKNGETHRFNQPVGKQYTYGKGVYEIERPRMENKQLKACIDIMGKYQEIERMLMQKQ